MSYLVCFSFSLLGLFICFSLTTRFVVVVLIVCVHFSRYFSSDVVICFCFFWIPGMCLVVIGTTPSFGFDGVVNGVADPQGYYIGCCIKLGYTLLPYRQLLLR